jgi:hypothetical protein
MFSDPKTKFSLQSAIFMRTKIKKFSFPPNTKLNEISVKLLIKAKKLWHMHWRRHL